MFLYYNSTNFTLNFLKHRSALGYNAEQQDRKDCSHGTYDLDRGETGNDQINKENVWYEYI